MQNSIVKDLECALVCLDKAIEYHYHPTSHDGLLDGQDTPSQIGYAIQYITKVLINCKEKEDAKSDKHLT